MTQYRSIKTHNLILRSAIDLFSSNGYDATGVADICTAAGVSKGAFYHHFATKQSVFLEILERWLGDLDTQLNLVLNEAPDVPTALLRMANMIEAVFAVAGDHLPMFLEFWSQSSHDPEIWKATVAPYRRYEVMFAAVIQKGIDEGSLLPQTDPHLVARAIISVAVGCLLQGMMDPEGAGWGAVTQGGIHLLLDGIVRR